MTSILVYPQLEFAKAQIPTPPYSILFIADYLLSRKVDVEIYDLRFDRLSQVLDAISQYEPKFIGLSVMTGPQIQYALNTSESIKKEFKDIKIVWGGVHATILPTQTLRNKFVDFARLPYYLQESKKTVFEI